MAAARSVSILLVTPSPLLQVSQDKVKALLRLSELERVQVRALCMLPAQPVHSAPYSRSICPCTPCVHSVCTVQVLSAAPSNDACTDAKPIP